MNRIREETVAVTMITEMNGIDPIKYRQKRIYLLKQFCNALFLFLTLSGHITFREIQAAKYDNYEDGCFYEILNAPVEFKK